METGPVSKTLCLLEYWMMDEVQKPSNHECYTPSSKPFRTYLCVGIYYFLQQKMRTSELHYDLGYELRCGIAKKKNMVETQTWIKGE
jgi:hypothetical protein